MTCCCAWFALCWIRRLPLRRSPVASESQTDQPGARWMPQYCRVFRIHVVEEGTGRGVPLVSSEQSTKFGM